MKSAILILTVTLISLTGCNHNTISNLNISEFSTLDLKSGYPIMTNEGEVILQKDSRVHSDKRYQELLDKYFELKREEALNGK